jgi:hypothetical protein
MASVGRCHWLAKACRRSCYVRNVKGTGGECVKKVRRILQADAFAMGAGGPGVGGGLVQCGPYNHSQLVVHLPMFVCAARSCTRRRTWCRAFLLCLCGSRVFLWCLHGSRAFLCCPRLCVCVRVCGAHVRVVSLHGCFNFCVILQLGGLASPWCGRCHWLAACRRSWLTTASAGFAKHQRRRHDSEREARGLRPPRLLLPNPRPQARSRSPRREDAGGEVADAVAGEAAGRPPRGWAPDGPWRPGGATATPLATLQAAGKLGDALGDVRAYACT